MNDEFVRCQKCRTVDVAEIVAEPDVNFSTMYCANCGSSMVLTLREAVQVAFSTLRNRLGADNEALDELEFLKDFVEGQFS